MYPLATRNGKTQGIHSIGWAGRTAVIASSCAEQGCICRVGLARRISWAQDAGKNRIGLPRTEGLNAVSLFIVRRIQFPSHAVVERQVTLYLPAILGIEIDRVGEYIFGLRCALTVRGG